MCFPICKLQPRLKILTRYAVFATLCTLTLFTSVWVFTGKTRADYNVRTILSNIMNRNETGFPNLKMFDTVQTLNVSGNISLGVNNNVISQVKESTQRKEGNLSAETGKNISVCSPHPDGLLGKYLYMTNYFLLIMKRCSESFENFQAFEYLCGHSKICLKTYPIL
jgi:hypothetical protein